MFGSTPATTFMVVSTSKITATSPAESAGPVDVTVTTPGGTSATGTRDTFSYVAPPTVSSVSPDAGPLAGRTVVTITGTGLTGATKVMFGATAATSVVVHSATQITAHAPAGVAGSVDVTVTTPGGPSATGPADLFTYVPAPAVTMVTPSAGPTVGGTSVSIIGTNFTGATAVKFGTTVATTYTVNSPTLITATAPAHTAGTVAVTVTAPGGTSASVAADTFSYQAPPTVSAVSPVAGPLSGGTSVTISGTNFTDATAVSFGSTPATTFTVVSTS
jgi:hypothetical protein